MLWYAPYAWLGRLGRDVLIESTGEHIEAVHEGAPRPPEARQLEGLTMPGLVNAHSHAFHRALRGTTAGSHFWAWRDEMFALAAALDPDTYHRLARATFGEMTLAGITTVGEFHYLHHDRDGARYQDPNEMGRTLIRAASEAGLRLTLLDTCYLRGDFDRRLEGPQIRFSDGSTSAWAARVDLLRDEANVRIGAAAHSVRALDEGSIAAVAKWAADSARPLHVHVSEQPAENERCLEATGLTPTELLAASGAWEANATAVHATHITDRDVAILGEAAGRVCLCPTTERDLADGIGPASRLAAAGVDLCVGTDSHAEIDLLSEARLVELNERLAAGRRGLLPPETLVQAATSNGAESLGWNTGRLEPGALADFATFRLDSPRTAGSEEILGRALYGASSADVDTVVLGGEVVVSGGVHQLVDDVGRELSRAIAVVRARM